MRGFFVYCTLTTPVQKTISAKTTAIYYFCYW